jgi:NhaA family Na+:H+ antiporter
MTSPATEHTRPTWIDSQRRLARFVARPAQRFLDVEASGGILLLLATLTALAWANSPWRSGYETFFGTEIVLTIGDLRLADDIGHWINDGLMALFFFVVGLEIKREWVAGELRDRRAAVLPAVAALGGMVVPALVYLAFNVGTSAERGWGIPMATDIAFALGVVAVLGRRVPASLKVFLLTLAIVDDIGAIVVIAAFYSDDIAMGWLLAAVGVVAVVVTLRRAHVLYHFAYVGLGLALWLCLYESGVHATIAGVVMGLLTPARPFQPELEADAVVDTLENQSELTAHEVRQVSFLIRESVPLTERLEQMLHPWTSYLIVPVFALANAGIELSRGSFDAGSDVTVGVVAGLVVGKVVGITGLSWVAVRLGLGRLPEATGWTQLLGAAALAGIGFTVSLFVTSLAFQPGAVQDEAKIGILVASTMATILGAAVLFFAGRGDTSRVRSEEARLRAGPEQNGGHR